MAVFADHKGHADPYKVGGARLLKQPQQKALHDSEMAASASPGFFFAASDRC